MKTRSAKYSTRLLALLLTVAMVFGIFPVTVLAADGEVTLSGGGTSDDPYLIGSAEDLAAFRDKVNATVNKGTSALCAKLTASFDLSEQGEWTPIAPYVGYSEYIAFAGTFDGNGFTISGLSIKCRNSGQLQLLHRRYCRWH